MTLLNRLLTTLLLLVLFSCSTTNQLSGESYREIASEQNCLELASSILEKKNPVAKNAPSIEIPSDLPEASLSRILSNRKELRERYEKVTESIRDFELRADSSIKGTTKLVLDPREGFLAKIMMIRNAKKTIDLSYYIFKSDDSGNALLHELRMAIKRGVKVRILVDSSGSISKAPFYDDIKSLVALSGRPILDEAGNPTGQYAQAEAVLFNPLFNVRAHVANWIKAVQNLFLSEGEKLPLATFTINRRSHDKILMIDAQSETDSMAIVGGRNMADEYHSVTEGVDPVMDAEIIVKGLAHRDAEGNIQNALEDHYNKIYFYLANKRFEDFLFKTNRPNVKKQFKKMRASANKLWDENGVLHDQLKEMEQSGYLNQDFEDGLVAVLNEIQNLSRTRIFLKPNGPQNKRNGNSLVAKLHNQIANAKHSIDVISPYFWVPEEEVDFIIKWAGEDPNRKIRIFANSISTTDNIVAQSMVDATLQEMIIKKVKGTPLEKQFEIYSYGRIDDELLNGDKTYGFLHAKIVVTDDKNITISTSNLDPISRHLNSEVGVSVENLPMDSKNLQKINKYIDNLQANSTLWDSPEWQEIRKHPKNRVMIILQKFITKIIYTLNLVPIL